MDDSIKVLIVEDEMVIAARISVELDELGYEVTGMVTRAEQVLLHCKEMPPDIILLDIKLKGSMDGVELAHVLNQEVNIPIIYLTANADEVTFNRAKETLPYAFISKPYKKLDLQRAMELVVSRLNATHPQRNSEKVKHTDYILSDRIFVKYRDRMVKIFLNEILFVEAHRAYCKVFTLDKEYLMTLPLKSFESKLSGQYFLRVHRSYIINLQKVDALGDHSESVHIGQHSIPVSKTYREDLINRLRLI